MEYLRGLVAAVKPRRPGASAAKEQQEPTTKRCRCQASSRSAVGTGGGVPACTGHRRAPPRRSAPKPLGWRPTRVARPVNYSHFCSHLAGFPFNNPVEAGLCWPSTESLLSSRSWVRITQGALPETAARPGSQSVRARDPTGRAFEPKQPDTPTNRNLLPGSETEIDQLGYCGAPDGGLPGRGRQGGLPEYPLRIRYGSNPQEWRKAGQLRRITD
jgi:hypothetical protein